MASHPVSRRTVLAALGGAAAGAVLSTAMAGRLRASAAHWSSGYVPDGTAGLAAAFPLAAVRLLASPLRGNQSRNTSYLMFVDPDRMLHTFRRNVGLPSSAAPCGGWEAPRSEVRGHCTGHLMSGLALTYANTGLPEAADKGGYLVAELGRCQARARRAGFGDGYLSAFPETFFDRLEAGRPVWSPYYMIHKIMAGLIDQHELAGNAQALELAARLGDWVAWRTARLSYAHMQRVLETEYGGLAESLANLYRLTWDEKYLQAAGRFYHARVLDPLAAGLDELKGLHANTNIPKMIACLRMWEETGDERYQAIAVNFWRIVTQHHSYVIGGTSNWEHWHSPDVIAGQLSNRTCENCCSYNMLKLTRLMHFHQPDRTDLLDYYERTLFNQMLGEQDPRSRHGFNIYYTGLSPGAFKRQPPFMGSDPYVYSTDYGNFSCDDATGMETQAKFADTIYTRGESALSVNLFVPSEVTWAGKDLTLRQDTGFPDEPATHLTVRSGTARLRLRVRIPGWLSGTARARLNGRDLPGGTAPGGWLELERTWSAGDRLTVTLPMTLAASPTPDRPRVQAISYGPVVLSAGYGTEALAAMPRLELGSVALAASRPLGFTATAGGREVQLIPVARMHHQHYNVYWQTA
jgi:uncharacterized protein